MKKVLDGVIRAIGILLRILLIISVLLIVLQVFFRYFLKKPLMWTEQVCRMIFIWMMMLGIPVLFHEKNFMSFDMLLEKVPDRPRKIVQIVINICVCAFALFWCYGSITLIMGTYRKITSGVRVPYWFLYSAQTVGSLMLAWVMAQQTVDGIRECKSAKGGIKQ